MNYNYCKLNTDKSEHKEESQNMILINNYNYALNEEFDYLDKEEELDSSELTKDKPSQAKKDKEMLSE